jgi:hypothetical protein
VHHSKHNSLGQTTLGIVLHASRCIPVLLLAQLGHAQLVSSPSQAASCGWRGSSRSAALCSGLMPERAKGPLLKQNDSSCTIGKR